MRIFWIHILFGLPFFSLSLFSKIPELLVSQVWCSLKTLENHHFFSTQPGISFVWLIRKSCLLSCSENNTNFKLTCIDIYILHWATNLQQRKHCSHSTIVMAVIEKPNQLTLFLTYTYPDYGALISLYLTVVLNLQYSQTGKTGCISHKNVVILYRCIIFILRLAK